MKLRTYDREPLILAAVARKGGEPLPVLEPGLYVEIPGRGPGCGGFGIIVGVTEHEVSVLWSKSPELPAWDLANGPDFMEVSYVHNFHVPVERITLNITVGDDQ